MFRRCFPLSLLSLPPFSFLFVFFVPTIGWVYLAALRPFVLARHSASGVVGAAVLMAVEVSLGAFFWGSFWSLCAPA